MTHPRCPKCRYVLMRDGTCPICGGRPGVARLPMLAPLPKPRATETTRYRLRLIRGGADR